MSTQCPPSRPSTCPGRTPSFLSSSMMCSATERTWVSEEPLPIKKKSVALEIPRRSRTTSSAAFRSMASSAARATWAGSSKTAVVTGCSVSALDPHLDRNRDVRVQPDVHLELTHRLDGLVELDPAAVELEVEALLLEAVGHVRVG